MSRLESRQRQTSSAQARQKVLSGHARFAVGGRSLAERSPGAWRWLAEEVRQELKKPEENAIRDTFP